MQASISIDRSVINFLLTSCKNVDKKWKLRFNNTNLFLFGSIRLLLQTNTDNYIHNTEIKI